MAEFKVQRQSVRAFAAASAGSVASPTVATSATGSDPTWLGYATIGRFPVQQEDGSVIEGIYIQWNNWPVGEPYIIERSTNLVDWEGFVFSDGDDGRMLAIFDLEKIEFYRIKRAWTN